MGELIPKAEPAEPTTDITFLFFDKKTFLRRCFLAIVFILTILIFFVF